MFNEEQSRVLQWRMSSGDVAAVIGPVAAGSGKTTTGAMLAIRMIAESMANRVLLVAYTNAAADEFGWELCKILHSAESIDSLCIRTGNAAAVDPLLPIPFSNQFDEIRTKKIVICTTRSLNKMQVISKQKIVRNAQYSANICQNKDIVALSNPLTIV
jgi:superfamily I DNA/RNA helicase